MSGLAKRIVNRLLPRPVATRLWSEAQYRQIARAFPAGAPKPHGLPGELIVSLTSYPARYATLHLTLRSLLRQDTAPDRIVLWIAEGDDAALPGKTRELLRQGIEMRIVSDARSYKKLIFALPAFPAAYVATADDDVFYRPDWLTDLVEGQRGGDPVITCHRAHRLAAHPDGAVALGEHSAQQQLLRRVMVQQRGLRDAHRLSDVAQARVAVAVAGEESGGIGEDLRTAAAADFVSLGVFVGRVGTEDRRQRAGGRRRCEWMVGIPPPVGQRPQRLALLEHLHDVDAVGKILRDQLESVPAGHVPCGLG